MGNQCAALGECEPVEVTAPGSGLGQNKSDTATVVIVGARGLRDADWFPFTGKSDCFCVVEVGGEEIHRTKVIADQLEPVWNEECQFQVPTNASPEPLNFTIYDKDIRRTDLVGKATLLPEQYMHRGFNQWVWLTESQSNAYLRIKVQLPGQDLPPGPHTEVSIGIEREPGVPLGIELDIQDGRTAYVLGVEEGACQVHNANAKPEEQLVKGDFIIQVNDATGDSSEILKELQVARKLEMRVQRPTKITVLMDRNDAGTVPLGMDFYEPRASSLIVRRLLTGTISRWNSDNPSAKVMEGDRVIAVSGVGGEAKDLWRRIRKRGRFQITVVRPANREHALVDWVFE